MPTKQIPMVSPDGIPGMVDVEHQQAAADKGYRPGVVMYSPQGEKGVVRFDGLKEALGKGYQSEAQYSGTPAPYTPADQNQAGLVSTPLRFAKGVGESILGAGKGIYHAVADAPRSAEEAAGEQDWGRLGTVISRMAIDPTLNNVRQAGQAYRAGDSIGVLGNALAAITPGGSAAAAIGSDLGNQVGSGDYAGAAGSVAGNAALGYLGGKVAGRVMAPDLASPVSPVETAARGVAKAINPAKGMQNLIEAIQTHGGDVTDFARRNGLEVKGALDYSKVARSAGDEAHAQYRQILDPSAGNITRVPTNYGGNTTVNPANPSFPHATLADINDRLGAINDLKAAAFDNPLAQGTMTATEKAGLDAEHASLADALHNELAKATGASPDYIAQLRQKVGKLNTIADKTNAAVNARSGIEASINQGTRFGQGMHSLGGAAVELANHYVRGGANKIADGALVKALTKASSLPVSNYLLDGTGPTSVFPQRTR